MIYFKLYAFDISTGHIFYAVCFNFTDNWLIKCVHATEDTWRVPGCVSSFCCDYNSVLEWKWNVLLALKIYDI